MEVSQLADLLLSFFPHSVPYRDCGSFRISSLGLRSGWNPSCVVHVCSWSAQLGASGFITTFSLHPATPLHPAPQSALLLHGVLRSFWVVDNWFCSLTLYRPGGV